MKKEFEQYFIKLLGSENAYFDDIHKRAYSYDATKKHYLPDGVLFPRNEEDISKILK
ncbi:FAD-binding oxidoreductase, partial [Campylobacter coli]|nr:FAD-binding oxidoreductase [Campylobacter coli]